MATINVSGIFAKYHSVADLLITEINATNMTLHFSPMGGLTTAAGSTLMPINTIDYFGNAAPVSSLGGRIDEAGTSKYPATRTNDILVRAYWTTSKYDSVLKVLRTDKGESILKIISFTTDTEKLRDAQYAIVNGYRVIMTDPPVPYGFGKRYSYSYWKMA